MPVHLFLIAVFLQIVWGLVPTASKWVIQEIPVELYISLRWTISGLIFFVFLFLKERWIPTWNAATAKVAVLGIFGYALGSFGTLYGLKIGGVANFALMAAFSPMLTTTVAMAVLKERPQKSFFFALAIALSGLLMLVFAKYSISSFSVAISAALLIMGAFFLEAIIFVYSKKLKSEFTTFQYLAISQMAAAAFMWFLQFFVFRQVGEITLLSATGWEAAIFVSVVACVLCYAVLYWLLNYVDGHKLSLFDGIHMLSAVSCGVIFFGDQLSPPMILGGILLLCGLVLGSWRKKTSNHPASMQD